eukprot:358687-Chlamydomonas_euryale.AAC.7
MLIERGASLKAKDNNSSTALHCAVSKNRMTVVPVLLEAARQQGLLQWMLAERREGLTPLERAEAEGKSEIAEMLRAAACLPMGGGSDLPPGVRVDDAFEDDVVSGANDSMLDDMSMRSGTRLEQ